MDRGGIEAEAVARSPPGGPNLPRIRTIRRSPESDEAGAKVVTHCHTTAILTQQVGVSVNKTFIVNRMLTAPVGLKGGEPSPEPNRAE